MKSLKYLYRVGRGPSSSHTIGPFNASIMFKNLYPTADNFKVILYGSLAKTGKGHMTDMVIKEAFENKVEIVFDEITETKEHPNTMELFAYNNGELLGSLKVFSVGGGEIQIQGQKLPERHYQYSCGVPSGTDR